MQWYQNVLSLVRRRVYVEMNNILLVPCTVEDVRKALFDIGRFKTLGPNGIHAILYIIFWLMLKDDLIEEVPRAVNTCTISSGWNETAIVMIPKINSLQRVTRFIPISMCNVVYRNYSKMLAA